MSPGATSRMLKRGVQSRLIGIVDGTPFLLPKNLMRSEEILYAACHSESRLHRDEESGTMHSIQRFRLSRRQMSLVA